MKDGSSPSLGSGASLNADFLFEVNTLSDAQTIAGIDVPAGSPVYAMVHAEGDLSVGSFDVQGTFDFTLDSGRVVIAAAGSISLGALGTTTVGGILGYDAQHAGFYGLFHASLASNPSLSAFSIQANFQFAINTTSYQQYASGFTINQSTGDVTNNPMVPIPASSFSVEAGGTITVAGVITLSGEFDMTASQSGLIIGVHAAFQGLFSTTLTVNATADLFTSDSSGSGGLALRASVSGGFNPNLGLISLSATPTLIINTSNTTRDGIAPQTYEVQLDNAKANFFGLTAGGTVTAGITNGAFEIDVPQNDPLRLDFFGLGSMSVYGSVSTTGQLHITGSVGFNLSDSVGDLYGSLTITVSNSGFDGSIDAGCDVNTKFGSFTIGSVAGDLVIQNGYFHIDAHGKVIGIPFSFGFDVGQARIPSTPAGIYYFSVPTSADEGQDISLFALAGDGSGNAVDSYQWSVARNGVDFARGDTTNGNGVDAFTLGAPGTYTVRLTAGGYTRTATIHVADVAPSIDDLKVPQFYQYLTTGSNQHTITPNVRNADPGDSDNPLSYTWTVVKNGDTASPQTYTTTSLNFNADLPNPKLGADVYTIALTVSDLFGGSTTSTSSVTVYNPGDIRVTNLIDDDSAVGSLPWAIDIAESSLALGQAVGGVFTINIDPSLAGQTMNLGAWRQTDNSSLGTDASHSALALTQPGSITIDGSAAPGFTISAANAPTPMRIFFVGDAAMLNLHDLNLTGGKAAAGGAIFLDRGADVDLFNSAVYGNEAFTPYFDVPARGGAVYVGQGAVLQALQTTFANNSVSVPAQHQYWPRGGRCLPSWGAWF